MAEGSGGAIRELLAVFGFGVDTKELDKGQNKLGEFLKGVKEVAEGIAAAFAVEQIYEFAEGQARAMNAIERTGTQLGITTDRVQEFTFAAKSLGLEADSLLNSMGRLQVSQQMATQGNNLQSKAFQALGVNVKDSNGHFKQADDLMLDVADGISKMHDPSKQAAAAVELFGRQGRELLPFLKEGRAGAEEYFKTFKELGGGYTEEALKAGKDFDKQQAKTSLAMTALKNTIAKALLPVVTALSHGVQVVAQWFNKITKDSHIVRAALITLAAIAAPFAIEMAIAAAPLLLIAAAIAAVILAVDDLYTFLTGGDSAIGELIDKIFGEGAQTEVLAKVKESWEGVKEVFKNLVPYVKDALHDIAAIVDRLKEVGEFIGKGYAKVALQNPDDVLGDKSKTPLTADQRENAIARMHMRQQEALASGASLPTGYYGPLNAPSSNHVKVDVHVPPGLDEKQVGEHVAKQVHEVMKQDRRSAAATLPRSGS